MDLRYNIKMMNKIFTFFALVVLFSSCASGNYEKYRSLENTEADYPIIPKPAHLTIKPGGFRIDDNTQIFASGDLSNEATILAEMLQTASGKSIKIGSEKGSNHGIYFEISDNIKNEEGYELWVDFNRIRVVAKNAKGIFYGIQSLRQLLPPQTETTSVEKLIIPAVEIKDEPRFTYRGMHLDVGRHVFPVDFIRKYIDMLALHKMNNFHWHLTDDQGWRIEIKKYPKLTEVGSIRKETMVDKNFDPYKGDGKEYGGFYTQDEVREVVAYAQKKHVNIIPEIELPGHARAALAAYPEFGNGTGPYEVATKWGVFEQIYAPKEETFQFLENVLDEVMALFPSKYIHIGGDEVPKTEWEKSAQAQEVIKREGLKNEHELQSYFVQRIEKYLNDHGRKIIGWDEILEGGLAPNATVMSWRGMKGGIAAAKEHHNVIMTPGSHLYFDHYQADAKNEPLANSWIPGQFTSVEKVYSFEPIPKELSDEESKYILGAQANVWTEYIKDSDHVEYMVVPRAAALAEVVWTPKEKKDWENFKNRLKVLAKRYDELDFNYAKHVFE